MSDERRCRSCGAPLAEDQRYCLNCGERQGEPRVDFSQYEASEPQPQEDAPSPPKEERPDRDYTPLAAVGGIAVLGIMLLLGVLIGKGDSDSAAPPPAQVVVPSGEADTGDTASKEGSEGKAGAKEAKAKGGGGGKGAGVVKGGSTNTGNAPVASDDTLQQLQEGTPEEKAENSANLPDEIATPGAPPPEDNEAPGGGSKGTAIE